MADISTLAATKRTEFGKGAARRTRRDGRIPVVLYGHGTDPVHLSVPSHETFLVLKGQANALLQLEFDGTSELALVKDVQRDPVKRSIEHLDLVLVRRGEKVTVDVPVVVEGESAPGTIHSLESQTLQLEADALNIPNTLVVNITGRDETSDVRAADVELPEGVTLLTDPESTVVSITIPQAEEVAEEAEVEPAAAEAAE